MADPKPASAQPARLTANLRSDDIAPELAVRRLLHAAGLRFALRPRELPGSPDLVLPKRKSVVFVHGCFWHGHDCRQSHAAPNFKVGSWAEKIAANRERNRLEQEELRAAGWQVETVWECEVDQPEIVAGLATRLRQR